MLGEEVGEPGSIVKAVARARFSSPSALVVASFASPESSQKLPGAFERGPCARLFRSE
jgi:hypothetical protein